MSDERNEDMLPQALTVDELRLLAHRERNAQKQRDSRRRRAEERAQVALMPNAGGFVIPKMPGTLRGIRKWLRLGHDAYSERKIGVVELAEMRRSASAQGEMYHTGAEIRKGEAAIRAAEAQERMADTLAAVEHGGHALLMLSRLQEGLSSGQRRPIPSRLTPLPSPAREESPA